MVRLREIQRTAAFAWSPGATKPLIVTGTRAGAVNTDFSSETKLELFDLDLDGPSNLDLQPIASISSDQRFYDLAWSQPDEKHPQGIIACALEQGTLDLYDAAKLISGASAEDSLLSRTSKHSGAIKSLQFSPLKPNILTTAGAQGEVFVYDVNDVSSAQRLGTVNARPDEIECVAWNRTHAHILAWGSTGGLVTVWDLKNKKESLTLNNNRKAVSAIEWDPVNSTKLVTASLDDHTPVIYKWDLRNANAPEVTMQDHLGGVLSINWCPQDPDLLVSCGKDSRTLLWNPQTGQKYGEFHESTNWNFSTKFHPHNPFFVASASFDGKIVVQTLQNTNPTPQEASIQGGLDGEDFFASAQAQPKESSFSLSKPPRWLERPIGASFGFGGKLIIFKSISDKTQPLKVVISQFSFSPELTEAATSFETKLSGDIRALCEERLEEVADESERADWELMKTLADNGNVSTRDRLVEFLGFNKKDIIGVPVAETEKSERAEIDSKKDGDDFFGGDDDGELDEEDFMASISASKSAKTGTPFSLYDESETNTEQDITRLLALGGYEKAVDLCIQEKRWADAFIIANYSGASLKDKVQAKYLIQAEGKPSYLRVMASVINKNLWDVVQNANLNDWKQAMAILCTYADSGEFSDLCETLGDRVLETGDRKNAAFCYLVGSKLDKVVDIWMQDMERSREAFTKLYAIDSSFTIHTRILQAFIEKVEVFRAVTGFKDTELSQTADWKLSELYSKYSEYADIVAEQGQLNIAQKYLDLLPAEYPLAKVSRERVKLATTPSKAKSAATVSKRLSTHNASAIVPSGAPYQPISHGPSSSIGGMGLGFSPAASNIVGTPSLVGSTAIKSFNAPPGPNYRAPAPGTAPVNPYASVTTSSPSSVSANPYAPSASANSYVGAAAPPPAPSYGGFVHPVQNFGVPPRSTPSTVSIAPPSKAKNMTVWNDVPMVTKVQPRKSTPQPKTIINSPLPGGMTAPPLQSPYGPPSSSTPPPPPPPKGPAPTARVTSPLARPSSRPQSQVTNPYAPTPPPLGPTPNRVNSPATYGTQSNRYAPAPVPAPVAGGPASGISSPPSNPYAPVPPPSNPYAPAPSPAQSNPYAQGPYGATPPPQSSRPPVGPPPVSRPPLGPPPKAGPPPIARPPSAAAPPGPSSTAPSVALSVSGDQGGIPENAREMVEIISKEVAKVASLAPQNFAVQVKDTQKRINLLFDHLSKGELVQLDTIEQLSELSRHLAAQEYQAALDIQANIQKNKPDQCGKWMAGVKRLISMSRVTNAA